MRLATVFFGLVLAAAPALAADAPTPQPAKPSNQKLRCVQENTMGSRLGGKRVCRTEEEWQQYRAEMRETIERTQVGSSVCPSGAQCE